MENHNQPPGSPQAPRLVFTRAEAADALAASVGFIDVEIRRGRLQARKLGRKVVILRSELLRYLGAPGVD